MFTDDKMFEISDELLEAARKQADEMRENEITRRWFTTAMRQIVLNNEHKAYKELVYDAIGEKIESWTDSVNELVVAHQTYAYALQQMDKGVQLSADDYTEVLVAKIIIQSLENKLDLTFGQDVSSLPLKNQSKHGYVVL